VFTRGSNVEVPDVAKLQMPILDESCMHATEGATSIYPHKGVVLNHLEVDEYQEQRQSDNATVTCHSAAVLYGYYNHRLFVWSTPEGELIARGTDVRFTANTIGYSFGMGYITGGLGTRLDHAQRVLDETKNMNYALAPIPQHLRIQGEPVTENHVRDLIANTTAVEVTNDGVIRSCRDL
jgi:hypothetical protein